MLDKYGNRKTATSCLESLKVVHTTNAIFKSSLTIVYHSFDLLARYGTADLIIIVIFR